MQATIIISDEYVVGSGVSYVEYLEECAANNDEQENAE